MLGEVTTEALFHFFIIFSRMGAALLAFPGFGEVYVSARSRLVTALTISFVLTPVLSPLLPAPPGEFTLMVVILLSEALVGLFIGASIRMLQAILHISGMIIAFQSSLASAILFDATQGSQGSVIGNFMTIIGVTLLFTSDLHHLMLAGVVDSYLLFDAGTLPPLDDLAYVATKLLSDGFIVATKIASPLIVTGLLIYLAGGILGRLMPNMQVFFVLIPVQIYVSFFIFLLLLSAGMMYYLDHVKEVLMMYSSRG